MNLTTKNYTTKAHQWLTLLEQVGYATAEGFGNAVCRCRRNGWCRWVSDSDGHMVPSNGRMLEEITDAGRAKLAEWDAAPNYK